MKLELSKQNKNILVGGLIIAVLFILFRYAKNMVHYMASFNNLTKIGDNTQPTITENQARNYCSRIIIDCKWFQSDTAVYKEILKLRDSDLQLIANTWIIDFYDENDGRKLQQYISDEKITLNTDMQNLINRLDMITE